jgi:hypothetical protein
MQRGRYDQGGEPISIFNIHTYKGRRQSWKFIFLTLSNPNIYMLRFRGRGCSNIVISKGRKK